MLSAFVLIFCFVLRQWSVGLRPTSDPLRGSSNYECGLHITPLQMYHAGFAHLYFAELAKMSPDSTRELVRVLADRVKLVIAREIFKQSTGKVLAVSK